MARARKAVQREIRCYLCGHAFVVPARAMSTSCPGCNKAIKVEDLYIKSYMPINAVQTCGTIKITRRGHVAARSIQAGDGIVCEGAMEGNVTSLGSVHLGPKAEWRGKALHSESLVIENGAVLIGRVTVPWQTEVKPPKTNATKPSATKPSAPTPTVRTHATANSKARPVRKVRRK
jgi:cytoskeletal protein CcmA (bactofilin family)